MDSPYWFSYLVFQFRGLVELCYFSIGYMEGFNLIIFGDDEGFPL